MTVVTATGKEYEAQRCYISDLDGVLNIGLMDVTIAEAATVFGNPEETSTIICNDEEAEEKEVTYEGYTVLTLITIESRINGAYLVLHK